MPFSYEGLTYLSSDKGDLVMTCEKKFGSHGTVKNSKGYEAKLKKAAKGSVIVVHATKPDDVDGYGDDAWTLFHVHQDAGGVKLDGITSAVAYMAPG